MNMALFYLVIIMGDLRGGVTIAPDAYPSREECTQAGNMATTNRYLDFVCIPAPKKEPPHDHG